VLVDHGRGERVVAYSCVPIAGRRPHHTSTPMGNLGPVCLLPDYII
jgi:hypothetical protein